MSEELKGHHAAQALMWTVVSREALIAGHKEDGRTVYRREAKTKLVNAAIAPGASVAKVQVVKRVNRLEQGNFGDYKFCRDGVWEMRIDVGAGYRVYYAQSDSHIFLLLCGGDKQTQDADIERAVKYWQDWQRRSV
jgi:putative addiction module killer protein